MYPIAKLRKRTRQVPTIFRSVGLRIRPAGGMTGGAPGRTSGTPSFGVTAGSCGVSAVFAADVAPSLSLEPRTAATVTTHSAPNKPNATHKPVRTLIGADAGAGLLRVSDEGNGGGSGRGGGNGGVAGLGGGTGRAATGALIAVPHLGQGNVVPARSSPSVSRVLQPGHNRVIATDRPLRDEEGMC